MRIGRCGRQEMRWEENPPISGDYRSADLDASEIGGSVIDRVAPTELQWGARIEEVVVKFPSLDSPSCLP